MGAVFLCPASNEFPGIANRSARITAAALPTIRKRRITTARRMARSLNSKAAGSMRRASAREISIPLEVEIRDGTEVWVKFERFQDGTAKKMSRRTEYVTAGRRRTDTFRCPRKSHHEDPAPLVRSTHRPSRLAGQLVSAADCRRPGVAVRLAHDDRFCLRRPGNHRAGPLDVLQCRAESSWESVFYLQYHVLGGWLLRAMHFYTGQATWCWWAFTSCR